MNTPCAVGTSFSSLLYLSHPHVPLLVVTSPVFLLCPILTVLLFNLASKKDATVRHKELLGDRILPSILAACTDDDATLARMLRDAHQVLVLWGGWVSEQVSAVSAVSAVSE